MHCLISSEWTCVGFNSPHISIYWEDCMNESCEIHKYCWRLFCTTGTTFSKGVEDARFLRKELVVIIKERKERLNKEESPIVRHSSRSWWEWKIQEWRRHCWSNHGPVDCWHETASVALTFTIKYCISQSFPMSIRRSLKVHDKSSFWFLHMFDVRVRNMREKLSPTSDKLKKKKGLNFNIQLDGSPNEYELFDVYWVHTMWRGLRGYFPTDWVYA